MFMAFSRQIACTSQKFVDDTHGAILPIFAIVGLVSIVIAGAGIDYGRAVNDREIMANALDASALAVAAELSTTIMTDEEIGEMLEEVFEANLTSLGLSVTAVSNMDFTVNPDEGVVSVSTTISVPTYFIGLGGIGPDSIEVVSSTEVNYSKFDVELSMVLDVTGSMNWAIGSLREAALELVDVLVPDGVDESDAKIRIAVVPYSVGVNLGDYADDATDGESSKCATERTGDEQYTDASYEAEPIGDGSGTYRSQDCSNSLLLPLTDNRSELIKNIKALTTDGYTAGQTGIAWGWYTLSPNWAKLWPTDSKPEAYDNDDVIKFSIIMTDGNFNTFYDLETWSKSQCKSAKKKGDYDGSCKSGTNDYWVEDSSSGYNGTSSKRARELCDAMKEKDIRLYTVYFGSSSSSAGAKVMQYCASDGAYYQATSSADLISAFGNIAKKIQSIYLAK